MRLFGTDLVLLHPPSVYDFRKTRSEYGPISDVIFSSPAFEMYPIGLTSIASHLEEQGHNVRIVNVAHRMLSDPGYDAEAAIARLHPAVFGIGLHWLPHAHGALELARIVRRHHPATPIVFGGISASYFHEELIRSPFVDFVLRGDSAEEPMLQLLRALQLGGRLEDIPNLTWKRDGDAVVNPLTYVPSRLDGPAIPDVFYAIRSVFKYRSLADVVPFTGWLEYPITGLLTARGCSMACAVCGGSRPAYRAICNRPGPAFRAPEALVRDIHRIRKFSRGPIFLIHDLRQAGRAWTEKVLSLLGRERPRNEIVLELFSPVADDYLERIGAALPRWSVEITLESHLERIRALNRRFDCSNEAIESTIRKALENGAGRVDLFFLVGLPGQSSSDAVGCVDFCRSLLETFRGDRRLSFFVAPLAPFLDPGSEAYEKPESSGYRVRFRTLDEYSTALTAPSWKHMLNYETEWMTRDEIVAATYEALRRMTRLKREWGQIDGEVSEAAVAAIDASEKAVSAIDDALRLPVGPERESVLAEAQRGASTPSAAARFQKNALVWPIPGSHRFAPLVSLAAVAVELAFFEARLLLTRRLPLYLSQPRHVG
ncbi:MAG TPA: TIGR04190 family B12-binding domain/radical SAM domain protein [Thermoanaerobaculia bacterium]